MTNYMIKIEVPEGEVERILDKLQAAQRTISECYSRLMDLGVVTIKEKPSAATDGNSAEELKALVSKSIHDTIQDIQHKS